MKYWGIELRTCEEMQENVWNINNQYTLKASSNSTWTANLKMYNLLRDSEIPTPEVIHTLKGVDFIEHNDLRYFLMRRIKGRHLDLYEILSDSDKAELLGTVIAKLHKSLANLSCDLGVKDANILKELHGWINKSITTKAVDSYANSVLRQCTSELEAVYDKLPRQLIHRDMHLGNLLFDECGLSGYIDLDLSEIKVRVFDIAYILSGWLVGETQNIDYMGKWKKAVKHCIIGYEKEQELLPCERKTLGLMMCCIELLFVAYFYSIDDENNAKKADECLQWLYSNRNDII